MRSLKDRELKVEDSELKKLSGTETRAGLSVMELNRFLWLKKVM